MGVGGTGKHHHKNHSNKQQRDKPRYVNKLAPIRFTRCTNSMNNTDANPKINPASATLAERTASVGATI